MFVCLSVCMNVCISVYMFVWFNFPDTEYLFVASKIFGPQLSLINHKICSRSCCYGAGATSTHNSHFMGKRLSLHPETNSLFCIDT